MARSQFWDNINAVALLTLASLVFLSFAAPGVHAQSPNGTDDLVPSDAGVNITEANISAVTNDTARAWVDRWAEGQGIDEGKNWQMDQGNMDKGKNWQMDQENMDKGKNWQMDQGNMDKGKNWQKHESPKEEKKSPPPPPPPRRRSPSPSPPRRPRPSPPPGPPPPRRPRRSPPPSPPPPRRPRRSPPPSPPPPRRPRRSPPPSPPPPSRPRPSPPPTGMGRFVVENAAEKEYQAYKYKKYVLLASTKRYDYSEAHNFCSQKGYRLVPYRSKGLKEPTYQLCYENRKGCWVGGKQGNNCAYIDPAGNGGAYARNCSERHHVVCYAKYP